MNDKKGKRVIEKTSRQQQHQYHYKSIKISNGKGDPGSSTQTKTKLREGRTQVLVYVKSSRSRLPFINVYNAALNKKNGFCFTILFASQLSVLSYSSILSKTN